MLLGDLTAAKARSDRLHVGAKGYPLESLTTDGLVDTPINGDIRMVEDAPKCIP